MAGRGLLGAMLIALTLCAPAGAQQQPTRQLLPDLRSRATDRLTFSTIGVFGGATVGGCFADEIIEDGARRCLRFDQSIANLGEGPFELRYAPPEYLTDPTMYQRIYRSDGGFTDRKAETYEFHPTHAHFHYKGFAQSKLWATDAAGERTGAAPVATGHKNGFCVMDIEQVRNDAPESRYHGDGCNGTSEWLNGITAGWADTYTADLPDQYIEVTGVPDGVYQLETVADPDNTVVELDELNNSVSIRIRITGEEVDYLGTVPTAAPAPPPAPGPAPAVQPTPAPAPAGGQPAPRSAPATTKRKRAKPRRCKRARKRGGSGKRATRCQRARPRARR